MIRRGKVLDFGRLHLVGHPWTSSLHNTDFLLFEGLRFSLSMFAKFHHISFLFHRIWRGRWKLLATPCWTGRVWRHHSGMLLGFCWIFWGKRGRICCSSGWSLLLAHTAIGPRHESYSWSSPEDASAWDSWRRQMCSETGRSCFSTRLRPNIGPDSGYSFYWTSDVPSVHGREEWWHPSSSSISTNSSQDSMTSHRSTVSPQIPGLVGMN